LIEQRAAGQYAAGGEARETLVGPQGKSKYERTFAPYLEA
jgi:hypothetical protein